MNFQELLQKMNELDRPVSEADKGDMDRDGKNEPDDKEYMDNKDAAIKKAMGKKVEETDAPKMPEPDEDDQGMEEECGMPGMANMPGGMMGMRGGTPPQPDSISANVSLNASGKGGIRDLMDILSNIESNEHGHDHEMDPPAPFGDMEKGAMMKKMPSIDAVMDAETFDNAPDEMYADVGSVIRNGGDLNREKRQFARAQPGDNPMAVESIKNRLSGLYEEIKNR